MALQALTQNEIESVSGGCEAECTLVDPPIVVELPGTCVALDPLVLVNGVFSLVSGVIWGIKHKLLACVA